MRVRTFRIKQIRGPWQYRMKKRCIRIIYYLEHLIVSAEARVPLVVEVVFGVAPALALRVGRALGTVLEWVVSVA